MSPIKELQSFRITSIRKIQRDNLKTPLSVRYGTASSTTPTAEVIEKARSMMPEIVDKMPDSLPSNLKNHYYMLRHGQSTANIAEIISSSRSLAYSEKHGLTAFGYEQGKESANQLLDVLEQGVATSGQKLVFVSSPFARARQTAEACIDGLVDNKDNQDRIKTMGLKMEDDIEIENGLMERYFGRLDADSIYTYAYVWPMDAINVTHTAFDVESVAAVCTRLSQVVNRCEEQYDDTHIVWVSHADVLQIGQLYAANAENIGRFSAYRFKNGEVRAVKNTPDSLPEPVPLEAPKRGTSRYSELSETPKPMR
jgi:broad specificity phosphatase PhoE